MCMYLATKRCVFREQLYKRITIRTSYVDNIIRTYVYVRVYLAFSTKNYTIRHDRFSDLVENRLSQLWIIIAILWNENENQPVASRRRYKMRVSLRFLRDKLFFI